MQSKIHKAQIFLMAQLHQSKEPLGTIQYRYEHSLRVTHLALEIAHKENADPCIVALAALLHDCGKFQSEKGIDHGRKSAELARSFLIQLDLTSDQIDQICYAIACHVDGDAGYTFEDTIEARIVFDADKIDQMGLSKMISNVESENILKPVEERIKNLMMHMESLQKKLKNKQLKTKTGEKLMTLRLNHQLIFYENWLKDLEKSKTPLFY